MKSLPLLLLLAVSLASACATGRPPENPAALAGRARTVLRAALVAEPEQDTVRLHAAEALVANGEIAPVHAVYAKLESKSRRTPFARNGIWRVLARCSTSTGERNRWVSLLKGVFLDPTGADRLNAIESLCKLGIVLQGRALDAARTMATGPDSDKPFGLWALHLAGEPGARHTLARLLSSESPVARLRAAYILGWLADRNPRDLALLAAAADREPAGTDTHAYVLGAAYLLGADPSRDRAWRSALEAGLNNGSATARAEACRCLSLREGSAAIPQLKPLLDSSEPDVRIAAAAAILHALR